MEPVEQYIRDMKFKKRAFGGVDEENALTHIKNICELYKQSTSDKQTETEKNASMQKELETLQAEQVKLKKENEKLVLEYKMVKIDLQQTKQDAETARKKGASVAILQQEIEKLRAELAKAQKELKENTYAFEQYKQETFAIHQAKKDYEKEAEELKKVVDIIESVKDEAVQKTKEKMNRINAEALKEIDDIRINVERRRQEGIAEINELTQLRDGIKEEIESVRKKRDEVVNELQACIGKLSTTNNNTELNFIKSVRQEERADSI